MDSLTEKKRESVCIREREIECEREREDQKLWTGFI